MVITTKQRVGTKSEEEESEGIKVWVFCICTLPEEKKDGSI